MKTLEKKLKNYKKQKIKELVLPIEMLKEAVGCSSLSLIIDHHSSFKDEDNDYYTIGNVEKYTVTIPRKIKLHPDYEEEENNKFVHVVTFKDGRSFDLPFSFSEFYRENKIEKIWEKEIYPNIIIGDIYYSASPATYLTRSFSSLLSDGAYRIEWDAEIPEGTPVIVYDKKDVDDIFFTKVLYEGQLYWCFGSLFPEGYDKVFNSHYI